MSSRSTWLNFSQIGIKICRVISSIWLNNVQTKSKFLPQKTPWTPLLQGLGLQNVDVFQTYAGADMCRAGINLTYQAKRHMNILFCHPGTKTLGYVFHPKIFVLVRHHFSTGTTECIWTLETLQHEPKGFFLFAH